MYYCSYCGRYHPYAPYHDPHIYDGEPDPGSVGLKWLVALILILGFGYYLLREFAANAPTSDSAMQNQTIEVQPAVDRGDGSVNR